MAAFIQQRSFFYVHILVAPRFFRFFVVLFFLREQHETAVPLVLVSALPPHDLKKKYGAKWALVTVSGRCGRMSVYHSMIGALSVDYHINIFFTYLKILQYELNMFWGAPYLLFF